MDPGMVQSIYDLPIRQNGPLGARERLERRERARARLHGAWGQPDRRWVELTRCLAAANRGDPEPLRSWVQTWRPRVRTQEQRVRDETDRTQRRCGPAVRCALELLRAYGRCLVLDLSTVADCDRPLVVEALSLEHRSCYAAAGTTRADFEAGIGRTGAR